MPDPITPWGEVPTGTYGLYADDDDVIGLTVAKTYPHGYAIVRTAPPFMDAFDEFALGQFIVQALNGHTTPTPGEGTRQRPGGWVDGIGWVVRSTDLRPGDKDEAAWVVRPGEVGSPFYSLAVVTRWADGTSPAPPAPLTRPDTAALRRFADGMVYDDLLTAARKGCFCEPHSKPCSDHMMYADGLEAGLRAATSPGTGDNP